ncbi:MAG TPA: hypothetical protein VJQ52_12230 [Steroidobacteraceae bacterium]|nr:hypothetical protein [Steroidobacteraceae bacterium]
MSTAVQLSGSAAASLGAQGLPQAPVDIGRAEDVYAAWKAVFANSRAVEQAHDDASQLHRDADQASGEPRERSVTEFVQAGSSGDGVSNARSSAGKTVSVEAATLAKPVAKEVAGGRTQPTASASSTTLQRSVVVDRQAADRKGSGPHAAERANETPESPAQPADAESVQVFLRGTSVAIVVRDTLLTADEAMHCALQTARELTGRSDTLRHLTLNGRTIYQQQRSSEPSQLARAEQSAPVLEFAC